VIGAISVSSLFRHDVHLCIILYPSWFPDVENVRMLDLENVKYVKSCVG
jgi:hypothetical protein